MLGHVNHVGLVRDLLKRVAADQETRRGILQSGFDWRLGRKAALHKLECRVLGLQLFCLVAAVL